MTTEIQPILVLAAEGISVNVTSPGVVIVTLFRPTQSTRKRLEGAQHDDRYAGVELRDKFDDGSWDVHTNPQIHRFMSATAEGPLKQKIMHVKFFRR